MNTLVVDIGGTYVKIWTTDEAEKVKLPSGKDIKPDALIEGIREITKEGLIDRVSIG